MRLARWFLLLTLSLALASAGLAAGKAAPAAKPQLSALILSGQNNHDWKATTPVLARILREAGFKVDITEQPETCTLADLRAHQVVVSNYNGDRWGDKAEAALLQYVREGGGFVVIHAANNAFADWPEYDRLIGGAWRAGAGHGEYHRYEVKLTNARHPITRGMAGFLNAEDELYHRMTMQPNVLVLATAFSSPDKGGTGRNEPVAWVVYYGKGRMFQTVLGHGADTMAGIGFITLVQRGTAWAATRQVSLPGRQAELLATSLADEDEDARYGGKAALIKLGPAAIPVLFDCLGRSQLEADEAYSALRWIAMRAHGSAQEPAAVAAFLARAKAGRPQTEREMALRLLGLTASAADGPKLAAFLADGQVREAALEGLGGVPGTAATRAIAASIAGQDAGYQARALDILGTRADRAGLNAALAGARDTDQAVRLAAMRALGNIGDAAAVRVLAPALGEQGAAHQAAVDGLLRLAEAQRQQGRLAAALGIYQQVLQGATSARDKTAALVGMARLGDPRLAALAAPLVADADDTVAVTAVNTLAAVPAPRNGEALAQIRTAAGDERPMVAAAALEAIGRYLDVAGAPVAIKAAASAQPAVRAAALRTLGQLGGRTNNQDLDRAIMEAVAAHLVSGSPAAPAAVDASLAILGRQRAGESAVYAKVLAACSDDRQRAAAVAALAPVARPGDLPVIEQALGSGDPSVRSGALDALASVAGVLAQEGKKQEAVAAYQRVLAMLPSDRRVEEMASKLSELGVEVDVAHARGFITHWWVAGPFPNGGNAAYETAYQPEQGVDLAASYAVGDRKVAWSKQQIEDASGVLVLDQVVTPADNSAAYCYAEVTSPAEQPVLLKLGSDDGAVLWLNGARLFGTPEARGLMADDDVVEGKLQAGVNRILVKALNGSSDFQLCLRLTKPDGTALPLEQRE